ncbi:MAG: glycoside hydrolase family 37, partial [Alistipes sp.]|nr:glycoside hydrolase family 37 [Alistipes sp.]
MKYLLTLCLALAVAINSSAQLPERTAENVEKYKKICRTHIYKDMRGMYREAGGALVYPFLAP